MVNFSGVVTTASNDVGLLNIVALSFWYLSELFGLSAFSSEVSWFPAVETLLFAVLFDLCCVQFHRSSVLSISGASVLNLLGSVGRVFPFLGNPRGSSVVSSLHASLIQAIVDFDSLLHVLWKGVGWVLSRNIVLNIVLEAAVKQGDEGFVVPFEFRSYLAEFGSVLGVTG